MNHFWKCSLVMGALVLFSGVASVSAYVESGNIKETNLNLTYPIFYSENAEVQDRINSAVADLVYDMKGKYDSGKYYNARLRYEVTYEDEDVISIHLIARADEFPGQPHGWWIEKGWVFDKHTGERIPLSNYVNLNADQLEKGVRFGYLQVLDRNKKELTYDQVRMLGISYKAQDMLENYLLGGNGVIYLIYRPAPAAWQEYLAPILVKIDSRYVDWFNRKA